MSPSQKHYPNLKTFIHVLKLQTKQQKSINSNKILQNHVDTYFRVPIQTHLFQIPTLTNPE